MKAKHVITAAAVGSLLGLSSAAMANSENLVLDFEPVTLGGDEMWTSDSFELDQKKSITIEFDYDEQVEGDGSWASDLRVDLLDESGESVFSVGGFGGDAGDNEWSFQGAGSDDPGTYGPDTFALDPTVSGSGYTIQLLNTFGSGEPNIYDVTVTFEAIPAPGALALLGVAGTIGRRRRRRA